MHKKSKDKDYSKIIIPNTQKPSKRFEIGGEEYFPSEKGLGIKLTNKGQELINQYETYLKSA